MLVAHEPHDDHNNKKPEIQNNNKIILCLFNNGNALILQIVKS